MPDWVWIFLGVVNLLGFLLMAIDKKLAEKASKKRIDEGFLLLTAVLFGSLGALLGSRIFRHKTRIKAFSLTLPMLILLHASWFWLLFKALPLK